MWAYNAIINLEREREREREGGREREKKEIISAKKLQLTTYYQNNTFVYFINLSTL